MESKYKRVNNMGRTSPIDERNRKFTYKELCAKYGFTEFPNGEKKNRQLQKLKDEYNLCQVGRYYVFRDPMVKEAIEEFVDPLEVGKQYTYSELCQLLQQKEYKHKAEILEQFRDWSRRYEFGKKIRGKYKLIRVKDPEEMVLDKYFTDAKTEHQKNMFAILVNELNDACKRQANNGADYAECTLDIKQAMVLFRFYGERIAYLRNAELFEEYQKRYPYILRKCQIEWREYTKSSLVTTLNSLKRRGFIDYQNRKLVREHQSQRIREATDEEIGKILIIKNETLSFYGISGGEFQLKKYSLDIQKSYHEDLIYRYQKELNIDWVKDTYHIWMDKKNLATKRAELFAQKDNIKTIDDYHKVLTEFHRTFLPKKVDNEIKTFDERMSGIIDNRLPDFNEMYEIVSMGMSAREKDIFFLFNKISKEIFKEDKDNGLMDINNFYNPEYIEKLKSEYRKICWNINDMFLPDA